MQTDVLRVLRGAIASRWHKAPRNSGQTELIRKLERDALRRDLRYLRQARALPHAHVLCGEGGTFLHLGWTTVSTCAPIERFPLALLAVARGAPFIDIRSVADPIAFANLPRVAREGQGDPKPRDHDQSVPLITYIDMVEALGARVFNDPRPAAAA